MNYFKILLLALFLSSLSFAKDIKYDKESGLIDAKGVDMVKAHCTACHSAKLVILQRGDRDTWLDMIRWMQKTQGLWQFDPETEDTILSYLESNYPPGKASRRPNLNLNKMPKNPYNK